MSFCPKCGHEQPDTNKFCTECGMPLLTLEADESLLPKQESGAPVTPASPVVNRPETPAAADEPMSKPAYFVPDAAKSESTQTQSYTYYQPAPARSESDLPPVRKIGFGEAVKLFFKQYATFSGRATRSEFWWATLFEYLFEFAFCFVAIVVGTVMAVGGKAGNDTMLTVVSVIVYIGYLPLLVPSLALIWRRLHDVGHSGWFILLALIPIANLLVLVQYFLPSDADNKYGPRKTEGTPEPGKWVFIPEQK